MNSIEVCAVCLITDVPMEKITATERSLYLKISGLQVKESKIMPRHFCQTCFSFLEQSKEFRKRCQIAHQIINQIHLSNGQLSKDAISLLDRKALGLEPSDTPIPIIDIKVDLDQREEKDPILNSNTNELTATVEIKQEDEEKDSVFVFSEPAARDDEDSDDDRLNIDDSMDAGTNENPEPASKVPPADSKKKTENKKPLTHAERQKRYTAKMKQNKEKYDKYKMKMRGYYHKRTKLINELSAKIDSYARQVGQPEHQKQSEKQEIQNGGNSIDASQVSTKCLISFEDDSS